MRELFQNILRAMDAEKNVVLVSVVKTDGSTPRGAGAHMLADTDGLLWGSVGGGPVEGRALELCREVLRARAGCTERFTLRDDGPQGAGSICGGEMTLYLHYISHDDQFTRSGAELAEALLGIRKQCWLVEGDPERGGALRVFDGDIFFAQRHELPSDPAFLADGQFVQSLLREERVYVFGGGHVAQALVPLLSGAGFRCTVVEDRPEFCAHALFPQAEETCLLPLNGWDSALKVTERDYLCIMTRGHEWDLDCLTLALRTPARYIGLMGSRRKIAFTNEQLRKRGFSEAEIGRVFTPIGLPIGAETPAEIAVSIAAQMIQIHAKGPVQ